MNKVIVPNVSINKNVIMCDIPWKVNKYGIEIENYFVYSGIMHPLSNTMERQHLHSQGDVMGDVKQEKCGSTNSLDNAGRKRYFLSYKTI